MQHVELSINIEQWREYERCMKDLESLSNTDSRRGERDEIRIIKVDAVAYVEVVHYPFNPKSG